MFWVGNDSRRGEVEWITDPATAAGQIANGVVVDGRKVPCFHVGDWPAVNGVQVQARLTTSGDGGWVDCAR